MERKIPITIGITGHRDIKPECVDEIKALLKAELEKIKAQCPNSDIIMLNSCASGADLLALSVAQELKMPVRAILPLEKDDYAKDFDESTKTQFEDALCYAKEVIVVPSKKGATRDDSYRAAGLYVAKHSHILFALWDGKEGSLDGCGTADIVRQTMENESEYAIIHVLTPRDEKLDVAVKGKTKSANAYADADNAFSDSRAEALNVRVLEHERGALKELLKTTDTFNSEKNEGEIYDAADSLSVKYQKKYKLSLISLALIGVAMVLAFLIYDELDYRICVPIWGLLLVAGALVLRLGSKRDYHKKYMEYRMLAECLRVQKVLDKANIDANAAGFYTWTHSDETFWIRKAIDSIECSYVKEGIDKSAFGEKDLVTEQIYDEAWIEEQLDYHINAADSTKKKDKKNNTFSFILKICTVASFIATLILEYFCGDTMQNVYLGIQLRTYFLVLIGVLSALTLLLSLYYGKLNLNRKYEDHINMIKLYKRALKIFEAGYVSDSTVLEIAREEVIENGNWYSYTKEETLDINI